MKNFNIIFPQCFETTPNWSTNYPATFASNLQNGDTRLGYKDRNNLTTYPLHVPGWYAESPRTYFDWQDPGENDARGLALETKDVFLVWSSIEYDAYKLLPIKTSQYLFAYGGSGGSLDTYAVYDYRIFQAKMITDPNENRSVFGFSPLGLMHSSGLLGKVDEGVGDIISESPLTWKPSVLMEYDFMAWYEQQQPVWVKTIQREKHYTQDVNSSEITKVEYSDGFGRLLQTRVQAEDVIFGDPSMGLDKFGDSGLPANQGSNGPAIGIQKGALDLDNVVVSGWKIYNNKGKVVEQYEPFFDKGFSFIPPFNLATLGIGLTQSGQKIKFFYDPRGQVIRTINPDATEQRVIYGKPESIGSIPTWGENDIIHSPWETTTYDANDLGGGAGFNTPKTEIHDALGRTVKTIDRLNDNPNEDVVMKYSYDIQGNLKKVVDALDRVAFLHTYDLRPKEKGEDGKEKPQVPIQSLHIDKGNSEMFSDVQGKPVESVDAKGARILNASDAIGRPSKVWARDKTGDAETLRHITVYGDDAVNGPSTPENTNHKGKPYKQYDEAGLVTIGEYDFKGSPIWKEQQVLDDSHLSGDAAFPVDWEASMSLASNTYRTDTEYDALNRPTKITYPEDINSNR